MAPIQGDKKMVKSTSFVQDQAHLSKSQLFKAIQPSQIEAVLNSHGFDLVHLKTGRAIKADRADHQTTVARYRSRDEFDANGLKLDLIFKVPHLYGALIGVLGLFRGVCANQMNVGTHFETIRVKHLGDPVSELNDLIPKLVAQRTKLASQIDAMKSRILTASELSGLARDMASIKLSNTKNVSYVDVKDLLIVRREEDRSNDLFTVFNVLQENLVRYQLFYRTESINAQGETVTRNGTSRRIVESSVKAIDLNASIWDAAIKLLKVG